MRAIVCIAVTGIVLSVLAFWFETTLMGYLAPATELTVDYAPVTAAHPTVCDNVDPANLSASLVYNECEHIGAQVRATAIAMTNSHVCGNVDEYKRTDDECQRIRAWATIVAKQRVADNNDRAAALAQQKRLNDCVEHFSQLDMCKDLATRVARRDH